MAETDHSKRQGIVSRVVAVLEAVVESGGAVGPRELDRTTGIDRSAVGRILQQLTDEDVLDRVEGGYTMGSRLFRLARLAVARDSVTRAATPILEQLSRTYDETCYVCIRDGDRAVHIAATESKNPVRYVINLGELFPLYAGAPGRAILSGLDRAEVEEILDRTPLDAITSKTITDRDELLAAVEQDAKRGFAATSGQRIEGGFAVGAPFFDANGACVGALVFTRPTSRLDPDRIPEYGEAVVRAAAELSKRLGFTPEEHGSAGEPG